MADSFCGLKPKIITERLRSADVNRTMFNFSAYRCRELEQSPEKPILDSKVFMTSIHCPECSTEVSAPKQACPNCNFPISKLRGLSSAILTRNAERVAGLIQLGADVNAVDNNARTPLMIAALLDDAEIVQMLLAAGAKPEFVNTNGETAFSVARSKDVERLIRRAIVVSKFQRAQTAPSGDLPQRHKVDNAIPIDVQLNEESFESLQSHKVHEEQTEPEFPTRITETSQVDELPTVDLQNKEEQQTTDFSFQPLLQREEPRHFFAAIIGASLLIMFMLLTWQINFTKPAPHVTQTVKPAKRITKPTAKKPEPAPIQKIEIAVPEERITTDEKPPLQVKNTLVVKTNRSSSTVRDEEKIRLGRALNNEAYTLMKIGRAGEAIPVLEQALRSFPKDTKDVHYAYALFNLGIAWRKVGRPDLAIPIFEKRIQIDNQREVVARELNTARQEAKDSGFDNFQNKYD